MTSVITPAEKNVIDSLKEVLRALCDSGNMVPPSITEPTASGLLAQLLLTSADPIAALNGTDEEELD